MPPKKSKRQAQPARAKIKKPKDPNVAGLSGEEASIYGSMLADARVSTIRSPQSERPLKKRRTAANVTDGSKSPKRNTETPPRAESVASTLSDGSRTVDGRSDVAPQQTAYDDSDSSSSSSSDESDLDLNDYAGGIDAVQTSARDEGNSIAIHISDEPQSKSKRTSTSRLPASTVEKKKRVEIHKLHTLCLLAHNHIRNSWCNDSAIQAKVKGLVNNRLRKLLHPSPSLNPMQQSSSISDGLDQVSAMWRGRFRITTSGARKARWATNAPSLPSDADLHVDKSDFLRVATEFQGSRDEGAQLFCAMLRSVGMDARLICSLQPLPFAASVPIATSTPVSKPFVRYNENGAQVHDLSDHTDSESKGQQPATTPQPIRRFGARSRASPAPIDLGKSPITFQRRKKVVDSSYPVYWVEVFSEVTQKWIAVDALATRTIGKPGRLEPPAADSLNDMTYVIAFNDDLSARDVTLRYAKAYNAKTRKQRVESTKGGAKWWKRCMKVFRRDHKDDRDLIEDAELARKEAIEPLPRNIHDFKDHPFYALERQLRHNEVIHPKRPVGKLAIGKGGETSEPIYRRRDVQTVHSADRWYRQGREIRAGEQPLKFGISRHKRARSAEDDSDADQEAEGDSIALYAEYQTALYVPQQVTRGRVPRNRFGNLDVYVPSMIPPGAAHIRSSDGREAAKIVGVDYADAVTGFQFKGRKGTAIIRGVIVASQFADAVEEVIEGIRTQREDLEAQKRSDEVLRLWKHFLRGLRIRERVMKNVDTSDDEEEVARQVEEEQDQEEVYHAEGGFFPDQDVPIPQPPHVGDDAEVRDLAADPDINDFAGAGRKRHFWLPAVYSPWDAITKPQDTVEVVDLDLFGDEPEPGGFVRDGDEADDQAGGSDVDAQDDVAQFGGGFVVDDEINDSEGGFVKEEDVDRTDPEINPSPNPQPNRQVSPVLMDEVKEEAYQPPSPVKVEKPDDAEAVTYQSSPAVEENEGMEVDEAVPDTIMSDAGSMLSHDPDDEDAEPDWLEHEATL